MIGRVMEVFIRSAQQVDHLIFDTTE